MLRCHAHERQRFSFNAMHRGNKHLLRCDAMHTFSIRFDTQMHHASSRYYQQGRQDHSRQGSRSCSKQSPSLSCADHIVSKLCHSRRSTSLLTGSRGSVIATTLPIPLLAEHRQVTEKKATPLAASSSEQHHDLPASWLIHIASKHTSSISGRSTP